MKNPPLTRDQQIHIMKTVRERNAARLERMQNDPELSAFLRGEGGEKVTVSCHVIEVSPELRLVDAYSAQSGNDPE